MREIKNMSKRDMDFIKNDSKQSSVAIFLRHRDKLKFQIGDILNIRTTYNNKLITVSNSCDIPLKFEYVYENEYGMGYIRQLKADGSGPGERGAVSIASAYNLDNVTFELDSDYLNHVMLGEGHFDYGTSFKKFQKERRRIAGLNNRLSRADQKIWANAEVGSTYYVCANLAPTSYTEVTITKNDKISFAYKVNRTVGPSTDEALVHWGSNASGKDLWYHRTIFLETPHLMVTDEKAL